MTPEEAKEAAQAFLDTGNMNADNLRAICNTLVTYMQLQKETQLYADNLFEKIVSYCKKPIDAARECLINIGNHDAASDKVIINPRELDEIADKIHKDMEETLWLDLKNVLSRNAKTNAYDEAIKNARAIGKTGRGITNIVNNCTWNVKDYYIDNQQQPYYDINSPENKAILEQFFKQLKENQINKISNLDSKSILKELKDQ